MTWGKEIADVLERGGVMPNTALKGYRFDWEDNAALSDEQNEKVHEWFLSEINKVLPKYATWYESTSEIVLPIDKVDDFTETVIWEEVLEKVYERYLEIEDEILEDDSCKEE